MDRQHILNTVLQKWFLTLLNTSLDDILDITSGIARQLFTKIVHVLLVETALNIFRYKEV